MAGRSRRAYLRALRVYASAFDLELLRLRGTRLYDLADADGWIYTEDGILNEFNMNLNEDGSFDAYFGECGDVDNNLPTVDGWNYILRIYEPKLDELQDFRLPEMKKVRI